MSTLIIPAYKAGRFLDRCLDSVAGQTAKPDMVLIGVDGCRDTLRAAAALADARRLPHMQLYWFPRNNGPYRVRNTLAMLAGDGLLHFFDADDEMFPDHLETMEAMAGPGAFVTPFYVVHDPDGPTLPARRAHGVVCIDKHDLVVHGGWEPWRCAADTEALQRWQWGGLTMRTPPRATLTVHRHCDELTRDSATRLGSVLREKYKAECRRRLCSPARCASIGVAECRRVSEGMSLEPSIPLPAPVDAVRAAPAPRGVRRMSYAEYMRKVVGRDPRRRRNEKETAWRRTESGYAGWRAKENKRETV